MINVLKEHFTKTVKPDEIIITATISPSSFNGLRDRQNHRLCFDYFTLATGSNNVTFVGVAKLKPGDTNNELEASRIAESKLERNYFKFIKRVQTELLKKYEEESERLKKSLSTTETNITRSTSHIKAICDRL